VGDGAKRVRTGISMTFPCVRRKKTTKNTKLLLYFQRHRPSYPIPNRMIASITSVTTLDLPPLEPYRTLKRPLDHLRRGIFVAEGEKVVSRLLGSGVRTYSLLLTERWFELYRNVLERHTDPLDIYIGERDLINTIVGHDLHQSIMAIAKVPSPASIGELSELIRQKEMATFVLLDGIVNAENMGVILRNCAALGADAVLVLPTCCDPFLRRSVRNSMGNVFSLRIARPERPEHIVPLRTAGMTFLAAEPKEGSKDIRTADIPSRRCLVLGAEGDGISGAMLGQCDGSVMIPMAPGVDSLNVASASAVLLYELARRG